MANFAKKLDLDNHVLTYRARLKSDYDRKLRAKNFAKLYYLNKEYSKALRYLAEFMSVKNDCPAAYKLQGRIQEALLERDNAVQSYMKSLELDQSQTDLFDKIMELIPHTNLEPEKVKLWTERFQSTRRDNEFLEKIKICSPPGNITLDILNNSINDSGTPISLKNPDLNLTERSDDIHSTPKSGRFASPKALSPYATKVNFEKIEKELIILSQAQEGIVSKVDKLQTDVTKNSSEIIDLIKSLQKNLEKINIDDVSGELKKNLTDIKDTVYKHTEMMDKVIKSQVTLEDAVYELTESYAGDTQGDGATPHHDENKPTSGYSSYNNPGSYPATNPYIPAPSDSTPKVESMFNPKSTGVFSRLGQSPGSGFMFQPPAQSNPSFLGSSYLPISPPAAEQSLPATIQASQTFQLPTSFSTNLSNPKTGAPSFGNYPSMPPFKTQPPTQTLPTSVAADNLKTPASNDPSKPLSELWQPKGWECMTCYVRNEPNCVRCVACDGPASSVSTAPVAFNFGIPPGTGTKANEAPNFSFSLPVKSQFDLPKDSSYKESPKNQSNLSATDTSFSSSNTSSNKSTDFSFKLDLASNPSGSPSFPSFTAGSPFNSSFGNSNKSTSQPSIFGNTKSEPSKDGQSGVAIFGNIKSTFAFKDFNSDFQTNMTKSSVKESSSSSNKPAHDVDLEIVYVKEPKSIQAAELAKKYKLPLNFYDYENVKPCPGCRGCDEDTPLDKLTNVAPSQPTETVSDSGSNLFAAAIAAHGATRSNWETGKSSWSAITTPAPIFSKPREGDDEENFATGEDAGGSENAIFKLPTIQMPDIVEVKTGEEEEEPQFVSRAKIFLFSDKDKEWKERGIGEFKILKHPQNNSYRMLLRRDKVLKIACNQRLSSGIKFEPLDNSENALTWAGVDYSEEPEKPGKFCIKFKNKELRDEFLEKVEDIKSTLSFSIV